jgi:hypothetical protein
MADRHGATDRWFGGDGRGSGERRVIQAEDRQPHDKADRHGNQHQPSESRSSHHTRSIALRPRA